LSRLLHRVPKVIWLAFPWLLFILLASSVARLSYLSYQERKLAGRLIEQLNQEKALAQEKNNFVTLSSHYLRTPMSTIANGLELVSSLGKGNQTAAELVTIGSQLNTGVNDLLSKAAARAPSEVQAAPGVISPLGAAKSMAAGFIRISSLQVMLFALTASFVLVGIADYILKHVDLYNVGLVNYLTQLAGLILVAILFYASLRSYHKRKQLREQAEVLLNQQRELDNGRNLLVRNSLNNLNGPLKELKIKLQTGAGLNPQALRPVLAGIAQLDSLFQKFVILTSLESGAMIKANQMVELNQLAGQSIQRYGNALQAKGLSVKNEVQSSNLSQDPLLLTFVIDSLLSNAIKYSPQGGEITINSRQRHDWVELFVKDSGPGIDEAKQAQLFQPFSRAENAAEDFNRQGVGLSLYLDRLVMSYLGGNLEINSKPGAGTTMRVGIAA
jgi:signal transduction histidine kinase